MRILTILALLLSNQIIGQRFISDSSYIHFYSDAPIEDIEAWNSEGSSVIDIGTMEMVYSVPITGFQFEKSLMQEHFNENYMESDKFPKATFSGKIVGWNSQEGENKVSATGEMTIHGRTNAVNVEGTIIKDDNTIEINAKFPIALADYKIKIPKAVFYNIAEVVDVTVYFKFKPYEN